MSMDYIKKKLCSHIKKLNISISLEWFSMQLYMNVHHEHVHDFKITYDTYMYNTYDIYYIYNTYHIYNTYYIYNTYNIYNT